MPGRLKNRSDVLCMPPFLVDIALPVPIHHPFTYLVPTDLQPHAKVGARVLVPFGRTTLTGIIVGVPSTTSIPRLKALRDVIDTTPSVSEEMLRLTRWIADYYFAPWGEVLKAALPQGFLSPGKRMVRLIVDDVSPLLEETKRSAPKQHAILQALRKEQRLAVSQLATTARNIHAILLDMAARGWIEITEDVGKRGARPKTEKIAFLIDGGRTPQAPEETSLTPKQSAIMESLKKSGGVPVRQLLKETNASASTLMTLVKKGLVSLTAREVVRTVTYESLEPPPAIVLNNDQQRALSEITAAIEQKRYKTFLLHGVTGSGKTQVYIEAIRAVLAARKTAIVLVPEISLTPQTMRRFKAHFGNEVAVMHSQMSAGERYDAWRLAHTGRVNIVIGPRSAIFAPLANLGLIVVDEEHESSYKQFDAIPRYHARDLAIVRANHNNAVVVLGSATPSAESYYNALSGKYQLLSLPQRVDDAKLPRIAIVDMIEERKRRYEEMKKEVQEKKTEFPKRLPESSVSRQLYEEIAERIQRKEGVILLQNRRGFSHVVECFECGYVEKCDNCEVTLTYHLTKKHLRCHYCGFVKKPPTLCPTCGGFEIRFHAFGTQQVQQELQKLFPHGTILRMDLDTTARRGAHDRILSQFGRGEADILLGTQMVAKGLDFPRVTLVGVISADTQMLLPDFRAAERTFQLLTQVAGRSGRARLAGEVIIQTMQPQHYSLKHVVSHDFRGFYREELAYRKELDYPPFSRIVLIEFSGERENEVQHHARKFAEYLTQQHLESHSLLLGPADAAIPRVRGKFRKHIILKNLKSKDPAGSQLHVALLNAKQLYTSSALAKNKKVQMTIDVDPVGMM
jgi:primosomal protein N' (replication factor Y)